MPKGCGLPEADSVYRCPRRPGAVFLALFDISVIQRLDLHHPAVLKSDLTHQLVRTEIVEPHFHGYLNLGSARLYPLAVDEGTGGGTNDRRVIDLRRVAAEGGDLGDAVTLGDELVAALHGLRTGVPGNREQNSNQKESFHHKLKLALPQ
jgi:hypothetical protein